MNNENHDKYFESRGYAKRIKKDYENGEFITALEYNSFINRSIPIKEELGIKKRYSVVYNPRLKRIGRRIIPKGYFIVNSKEYKKKFQEYEWEKYMQKKYYKTKPISYEKIFPIDFSIKFGEKYISVPKDEYKINLDDGILRYKKEEKKISNDQWKKKYQLKRCPMHQPIFNSKYCSEENSSDDEVFIKELKDIQMNDEEFNKYQIINKINEILINNEKVNVENDTNGFLSNQEIMEEEDYEKTEEVDPMEKNRIKIIDDIEFNYICKDIRGLTTKLSFEHNDETYLYINIHKICLERNSISTITFFILRFIKYVNIECDLFATIIEAYGMKHDNHLKGLIQKLELKDYNEYNIETMVINRVITENETLCDQKLKCRNIECEHCSLNTLICQNIIKGYYDCCYIYCTNVFEDVEFSDRVKIIVVDEEYNGPKKYLNKVYKRYNKGKVNEYYTYYVTPEWFNKEIEEEMKIINK